MKQTWTKQKNPLTTDNEKAYGKNYNSSQNVKKNNTTTKVDKNYGSAQRNAMKITNPACKY